MSETPDETVATTPALDPVEGAPGDVEPRGRFWRWLNTSIAEYGGGYYGVMALLTFLYLEVRTLRLEWQDAGSLGDFLAGLGFEFLIGFSWHSLLNGLWGGIWPFTWFTESGMNAVWLAAVAWLAYQAVVKPVGRRLPAIKEPEA